MRDMKFTTYHSVSLLSAKIRKIYIGITLNNKNSDGNIAKVLHTFLTVTFGAPDQIPKNNKKFELIFMRCAKAYSSSCSQTVSLSRAISSPFILGVCAAAEDRKNQ